MKKLLLGALAAATLALPALPALAAEARALVTTPTAPTVTTTPPDVGVTACATGSGGYRLACASVHRDGDGRSQATVCAYDGVLLPLGWADGWEVTCLESTEDWGFVSGGGVCSRSLETKNPQVCVNGRDRCVLWVMGVKFVCWVDPAEKESSEK